MTAVRRVGILVFDDVEVLDACGPFEVFSVAARVCAREGRPDSFEVLTIGTDPGFTSATARGGLRLGVDHTIDAAPDLDVLVVPGGVTDHVEQDADVIAWLRDRSSTPLIASVCTGAFLLATAGLVTDQQVTTHWEDQAALAARFPSLEVVDGPRWVRQGRLWTSAGISAGLDLSLELVAHLADRPLARATARQMDYAWSEGTSPS